jgi:hypothetical protein
MVAGTRFSSAGYDQSAHAGVNEGGGDPMRGDVVVLCNNSDHFLVCWRESPTSLEVELVRAFRYDESHQDAYAAALALMLTLALSN